MCRNIRRIGDNFQVCITYNGKRIYLGTFDDFSQAVAARNEELQTLCKKVPETKNVVPLPCKFQGACLLRDLQKPSERV